MVYFSASSAYLGVLCVKGNSNAEGAEIRRETYFSQQATHCLNQWEG